MTKILQKEQPAVFKSVDALIKRGMLSSERGPEGFRKFLKLTERGLFEVLPDLLSSEDKTVALKRLVHLAKTADSLSPFMFGFVNLKAKWSYNLIRDFAESDSFKTRTFEHWENEARLHSLAYNKSRKGESIKTLDYIFLKYLSEKNETADLIELLEDAEIKAQEGGSEADEKMVEAMNEHLSILVANQFPSIQQTLEKALWLLGEDRFNREINKIRKKVLDHVTNPNNEVYDKIPSLEEGD